MTTALEPERTVSVPGEVRLEGVGVRFDFDHLGRVLTPALARLRRIRATAWGLRDLDLQIEPGAGVAVIGPTGSGKTTLLRVLGGVICPDAGTADVRGRVGSLLATDAGLQAPLTGRENAELLGVLAGLSKADAGARIEAMQAGARLGAAFDRPVHTYSEGMRARLGFAVIQVISPSVLLLDEVFEALDHEFRAIVEDYVHELRRRGGVVVAAGHDHVALERICPGALLLDRGHVRAAGSFAEVLETYRGAGSVAPEA
ncbi:MAG: rfbB2 [Solirubrobacterales bacterium]|jgi:ABC-type polysaccharide/polyol phosphate transport system ATPase subunit|nr:rfbB2 [Solirubrobacterales bacterium]